MRVFIPSFLTHPSAMQQTWTEIWFAISKKITGYVWIRVDHVTKRGLVGLINNSSKLGFNLELLLNPYIEQATTIY
jgi:hypothetical protein